MNILRTDILIYIFFCVCLNFRCLNKSILFFRATNIIRLRLMLQNRWFWCKTGICNFWNLSIFLGLLRFCFPILLSLLRHFVLCPILLLINRWFANRILAHWHFLFSSSLSDLRYLLLCFLRLSRILSQILMIWFIYIISFDLCLFWTNFLFLIIIILVLLINCGDLIRFLN